MQQVSRAVPSPYREGVLPRHSGAAVTNAMMMVMKALQCRDSAHAQRRRSSYTEVPGARARLPVAMAMLHRYI